MSQKRAPKDDPERHTEKAPKRIHQIESSWIQQAEDEHALLEELKKCLVLLGTTPERIVHIDLSGKILFINHTITQKIDEAIGSDLLSFFSAAERTKLRDCIDELIRSKERKKLVTTYTAPEKNKYYFENHFFPVKKDGRITSIIISAKDITERKKAEKASKKAYDELEKRVTERTLLILKLSQPIIVRLNYLILHIRITESDDLGGGDSDMFCGYDFAFFPCGGDESASGKVIGTAEQSS